MKTVLSVLKKEVLNIVRNRRRLFVMVLFNLVLLPCLAIVPMWMITRKTVQGVIQKLEVPVQGAAYAPELIAYIQENESMTVVEVDDVEAMVRAKQAAAGLIIPVDFEQRLKNGESARVTLVVDESQSFSVEGERLKNIIQRYGETLLQVRLKQNNIAEEYLRPIQVEERNTATKQETSGSRLSLLIPGFIMTFGLTSGLSIAIGSIAGEKEEQTLEPVLFTPINRAHLVVGKLLAVLVNVLFSAFAFLLTILMAAALFGLGIFLLLRNAHPAAVPSQPFPAATSSLPFADLGLSLPDPLALTFFLVSMMPIILLGAALQIMISSIARNSEEAYTFSLPLNIVSLAPLVVAFFLDQFTPSLVHYAIPIFGTILSMRDLLSNHILAGPLSTMFISSIAYAAAAIAISIWMFNREEVVFRA